MKMEKPRNGLVVLVRKKIGDNKTVEVMRDMITDRDIVQVIRDELREMGFISWAMPTSIVQTAQYAAHKSPRFGDPLIVACKDGQTIAIWVPPMKDAIFRGELKRTQTEKMARARTYGVLCFIGDDPKVLAGEIVEALES